MEKYRLPWFGRTGFRICLALIPVLALLTPYSASARTPLQETEEYCLSCHNNPDLSIDLPDGENLSLYISPEMLQNSVHSQAGIECQACHTDIQTYPHPEISYQSSRALSRAFYLACQKCHSSNYEKTLDSIHAEVAESGNLDAPVCTDCHGAHDVSSPNQPRSLVSTTCGDCHTQIHEQFLSSVHGKALVDENNPDVPVCTDCHGVHNIQDARTAEFHVESPDLCARCHADQALMDKYGLSADVYDIYSLSWHGIDAQVYKARWPAVSHESAVCTDCHGNHAILNAEDPSSSVNPANLLTTCQKCHPDAGPNWTGAWTGHYPISQERTPYLFYVQQFYSSFASTALWGSLVYVLLKIVRAIVERVRRSLP